MKFGIKKGAVLKTENRSLFINNQYFVYLYIFNVSRLRENKGESEQFIFCFYLDRMGIGVELMK